MTGSVRIEFAPDVADDVDLTLSHMLEHEINDAAARVQDIVAAINVLERNPSIGRPTEHDLRELVIGRSVRGYVVLYRYVGALATVFVLAIRGQNEAGYGRDII